MTEQHRVRTIFKSDLLRIVDYQCAGGTGRDRREEWPSAHEIVLPRSGMYVRRDALGTAVADPTQVLFFNQGQPYEIRHPVAGGDCSTAFLLAATALPAINQTERPFQRSHAPLDGDLRLWQYRLLAAAAQKTEIDPLAVEEYSLTLLGDLVAAVTDTQADRHKGSAQQRDLAHQAKIVLNERYREAVSLSQIAEAVYCSAYHLCRVFKQEAGTTLHRYLLRLRLQHALDWMADAPSESLVRIALDCGFSSHSHLSSAFRQAFGLTPSEFRRSVKGETLRQRGRRLRI